MKSPPPKVSVIVPNYNHAKFLPQRMQSILNQSFQDFEIIILDDCSTDDSVAVLSEFVDDQRVTTCYNKHNSGNVFRQWNRGLSLARGELIWIAESDDYSDPDFLSNMIRIFHEHPETGLAFCCSNRVTDKEITTPLETWFGEFHHDYTSDFLSNGKAYVSSQMLFMNTIPNASSAVFRKSVADTVGPPNDSYRLSGDWEYWIRLLSQSNLAYCARPLNYYRFHTNTVRKANSANGVMLEEAIRIALYVLANFQVPDTTRSPLIERLVSWYIDEMSSKSSEVTDEKKENINKLIMQLSPRARSRLFLHNSGLYWLWLGLRRRLLRLPRTEL